MGRLAGVKCIGFFNAFWDRKIHFYGGSPSSRNLSKQTAQVMDQPGMITWEGKFGPDDSVEVDLTVPWAWASAPNGMQRFCVKPDDEGIGQELSLV